jgi:hypothetical protein
MAEPGLQPLLYGVVQRFFAPAKVKRLAAAYAVSFLIAPDVHLPEQWSLESFRRTIAGLRRQLHPALTCAVSGPG